MIKTNLRYLNTQVVFKEVPNEVSLAINISGCPIQCPDCHSKYLWEIAGKVLTELELGYLICQNDGISCVCFMGGDSHPEDIVKLAKIINADYPSLKVAWYSGEEHIADCVEKNLKYFDYIKIGPYIKERGPLNNPNTNQIFYAKGKHLNKMSAYPDTFYDVTDKFWRKDESKV